MKQNTKPNRDLEIAFVKIARALFEYVDAQDDVREVGRLGSFFEVFNVVTADYHNQTDRLHPDLCQDFSEWAAFKGEWLEALAKKGAKRSDIDSAAGWAKDYREISLEMIEYSERGAGYETRYQS